MKINIQLLPDGSVEMETVELQGPECLNSVGDMASLLPGSEIIDSNLKAEYFENRADTSIKQHQDINSRIE